MKKILLVLIKGCIGLAAIYGFNYILKGLDLNIGVNVINGVVVGLLGLPGFVMLYSLAIIDKYL